MTLCYKTRLSIFARPCAFQLDRKENKETFHRHIHRLSAEGLCSQKGQTPHPTCRKRRIGLDCGLLMKSGVLGINNPACFRVCSSQSWESWEPSPLPTLPVLFRCILLDVSSVFWLFFQSNLILINHPRRISLAKSEW